MSHINNEIPKRPIGRPKEGAEKRSVFIRFRMEPNLDRQLTVVCTYLGISKSSAIRQGVQMFLREAEKMMY